MIPDCPARFDDALKYFLSSLAEPARILVAVSGGSDSTGLLVGLADALGADPSLKISLCAASVDHGLRAESADEARTVAALCQTLGVPHQTLSWQGAKPKSGVMAAAREARYDLLAQAATNFNADFAVTAHTRDDQRETLLMRADRSSRPSAGIADLMLFNRRLWVARPLLRCSRAEIRAFLSARGIGWIDDPSNEDEKYERVRIRNQLMGAVDPAPLVPGAGEQGRLAAKAAAWLESHFSLHQGCLGQIDTTGLDVDPTVLGYGLSRLAAVFGGQSFPPGRTQTDALVELAAAKPPKRTAMGRTVFELRSDGLYMAREARNVPVLIVEAGASGIWDRRFVVDNGTDHPVVVEAAGRKARPEGEGDNVVTDLPRRPLSLAHAACPRVVFPWERTERGGVSDELEASKLSFNVAARYDDYRQAVRITPHFAPFDRFLTRFDVIFAQNLASRWPAPGYPRPPQRLIDGKCA